MLFTAVAATPGMPDSIDVLAPRLEAFARASQAIFIGLLRALAYRIFACFPARSMPASFCSLADRARTGTTLQELATLLRREVENVLHPAAVIVYLSADGQRLTAMAGLPPGGPEEIPPAAVMSDGLRALNVELLVRSPNGPVACWACWRWGRVSPTSRTRAKTSAS